MPSLLHKYLLVDLSNAFQTLALESVTQPKLVAEIPSRMLVTSHPSSGKLAVGLAVGSILGDTDGDLVGDTCDSKHKFDISCGERLWKMVQRYNTGLSLQSLTHSW